MTTRAALVRGRAANTCQLCTGWHRPDNSLPLHPAVTVVAGFRLCAHHEAILAAIQSEDRARSVPAKRSYRSVSVARLVSRRSA